MAQTGIGDRVRESFTFAQDALVGHWVRWIMLVISSFIFPIMYGYTVRIMRGVEPNYEEESFFGLFIDGVKLMVIYLVYLIIPMLVFIATMGYTIFAIIATGGDLTVSSLLPVAGGLVIGLLLTLLIGFFFTLLSIIASVRFSRTGSVAEAFAIGEILKTISRIGWIHYILSLLALFLVLFVVILGITIVEVVLAFIPVLGWIIGWAMSLLLGPFISLMVSRYYSHLYDASLE